MKHPTDDAACYLATNPNGMTFLHCMEQCVLNLELLANFDRLNGTHLILRRTPIKIGAEAHHDTQTEDLRKFIKFCWDYVFTRL